MTYSQGDVGDYQIPNVSEVEVTYYWSRGTFIYQRCNDLLVLAFLLRLLARYVKIFLPVSLLFCMNTYTLSLHAYLRLLSPISYTEF